jgi:hypothetical protein
LDGQNTELAGLRAQVESQHKRIKALEALVLPAAKAQQKVVTVDRFGWQKMANWDRLKIGMSHQQVVSLLGEPTRSGYAYPSTKLPDIKHNYAGNTSGAGYISGYVQIDENNQLTSISKPVI